jgi:hypothetical protein
VTIRITPAIAIDESEIEYAPARLGKRVLRITHSCNTMTQGFEANGQRLSYVRFVVYYEDIQRL